jgi:Protein kinase domain
LFRRWGGVGVLEELQPGDPVQVGPYRLTGVLGTGGMGRVFLGWSSGGRPVAVKVIRPELAADPEFRARFRREVAAARTISGLYTALLLDTDTDSRVPWLATAYVDGPSLAEAVTTYGPLPVESVRALAAGLAEALAAVHALGLVHRDLKPSNVLLASDGPRVIDFGISRAADTTTLTNTGQSIGSPGYLSPEQAVGTEIGPPSDIFSLGAVLAFAASGNGPFGGGSPPALIYRVVHQPPALEGVPAELRPLIERCLAKDPAQRPTAAGLLADLAGVQPGARWLPERITAALAEFAAPALTRPAPGSDSAAAAYERTATSAAPADGASPPATPISEMPQPAGAATTAAGGGRRPHWRRRSLLVPVASAAAVLAAAVVLAATLSGPGGSVAFKRSSPAEAGSLAAAGHPVTPAAVPPTPVPSKSATPRQSPPRRAPPKKTPATHKAPVQAAPSVVIVTQTQTAPAPPRPSSAPPKPTAAPAPVGGACSFIVIGAANCNSTNPQVLLYVDFADNTTGCSWVRDITWGDGTSSDGVVVTGGPAGPKFAASHTYAAPGTYTIYFGGHTTAGGCTIVTRTFQFGFLAN